MDHEGLISIKDLHFKKMFDSKVIQEKVSELGDLITKDYQGMKPVFISVLNGAFIFCSDLVRATSVDCEIEFMKLSSYQGLQTTGNIKMHFGLENEIKGRDIILVEDIVDKGHTINYLHEYINKLSPGSLKIASLLYKPDACEYDLKIDYVGFEIPQEFVVGYGLDYDGIGRNLNHIYSKV